MKKPQVFVVIIALVLLGLLYFVTPRSNNELKPASSNSAENQTVTNKSIIDDAKTSLSAEFKISLLSIENQLSRSKNTTDSLMYTRKLARFWADSANRLTPYLYYTYSAALLENSEKSLTFAAQQLIDNLITPDAPPALLPWMAGNAKVLLEKALEINPNNDSAIINLGACYLFGNISDNPMQGILKVKQVVDKNPQNAYGQFILALGGKKSGQYDKAIERLLIVVSLQPSNLEAMVHLAECYELANQKEDAIQWYTKVKDLVNVPDAKAAITKRIKELKK
ncbi:MAG: tetratricopeptide repeat protein [Chitinophagaceae bacterium]